MEIKHECTYDLMGLSYNQVCLIKEVLGHVVAGNHGELIELQDQLDEAGLPDYTEGPYVLKWREEAEGFFVYEN